MKVDLSVTELASVEYILKLRLTKRFGALQAGRAFQDSSHNVGNASSYVKEARILRKILETKGRESYKPLSQMHGGEEWLNDQRREKIDFDSNLPTLQEVLEGIQENAYIPPEERRNLTEHQNVPGN